MAKILECAKVDPSSGCRHVIRGETEEEVFQRAAEHAREHGIRDVTPELIVRVKANIRDAWRGALSVASTRGADEKAPCLVSRSVRAFVRSKRHHGHGPPASPARTGVELELRIHLIPS